MDTPPRIHSKSRHKRASSRRPELSTSETAGEEQQQQQPDGVEKSDDVDAANAAPAPEVRHENGGTAEAATEAEVEDEKLTKGILGYMDRQLKVQTLAASPQKSPAGRSTRSRSSAEKSPRRKRSKSESRRRRERKIIAAGEMEVRQANETLMRYLKQCSDFNDASLSGDLEIDESLEDRRVHRKTKAERQRKSALHTRNGRHPPSDLTAILNELAEDAAQSGQPDIYNPFTPVVSPLDGPQMIDKIYVQTSSGYRAVDNNSFYKSSLGLDLEENRQTIHSAVHLSCCVQRVWILLTNICHGLLAGLGLAHLLFIFTTRPQNWVAESVVHHFADFVALYASVFFCLAIICMVSIFDRMDISRLDLPVVNETISFRWIIIFLVYAATLTLSLCCGPTDEQLYLTRYNMTAWEEAMESNEVLTTWNALSVARSVGAIIGWILIGLSSNYDRLYMYLLEMERYQN